VKDVKSVAPDKMFNQEIHNFDVQKIRQDFPILNEKVYNKPFIYFDNGATTQKPSAVIECIDEYHRKYYSSIHRGVHYMSEKATDDYEASRKKVQDYIQARHSHEIVFTNGTTGSINALAFSLGEKLIGPGDEIILSEMEHHANIVPWQMLCERKGARIKVIPVNEIGELDLVEFENLLNEKTKLVSLIHVSNVLGTVNPMKKIIEKAHERDVPVIIDAAQSIQHIGINVQELDCDFLAFSGHKMYGPTGIGVLYGKEKWLDVLPPYQGGGDMVDIVTFEKTTYNTLPFKFEAGTTNFIGAIGLGAAIGYINSIGLKNIAQYEKELLGYATSQMKQIGGITIYGRSEHKSSIISFLMDSVHPSDAGMIMDKMGVAVRTGSHCAQPLMKRFGITGTVRASLSFYNTVEEIDVFIHSLRKVKEMLG
jgi:cysteine desulfurase / selenocysteine lyase